MIGLRLRAGLVACAASVVGLLNVPAGTSATGDWRVSVEHDLDTLEYDAAHASPRTFFKLRDCFQGCDVALTVKRRGRTVIEHEIDGYHDARVAWRCSRTGSYTWSATDGQRTEHGSFRIGSCRRKHRHYVSRRQAETVARYAIGNFTAKRERCRPASERRGTLAWRWKCRITLGDNDSECDFRDRLSFQRLIRFGYALKSFRHNPVRVSCRSL